MQRVEQGNMLNNKHWTGSASGHPARSTGICNWCPLVNLTGFDVIWDVTADLMHHILYFPRHVVKAMKGNVVLKTQMLSMNVNGRAFRDAKDMAEEVNRRQKENKRREARASATEKVYISPE